jgi:hypothetical protein
VVIHDAVRFEVWRAGKNEQVQEEYWKLFKESLGNKHRPVSTANGVVSILGHVRADDPDFSDLEALTG